MPDSKHLQVFLELAQYKARETMRMCHGETLEVGFCAAFSIGAQWALELAAIDPETARTLVLAIHTDHPTARSEWNKNARRYIDRVREGGGGLLHDYQE